MRRYKLEHRLSKYKPEDFGRVAVLMGGISPERDISLLSGAQVLDALVDYGIDARAFDPKDKCIFDLPLYGFDRVFIALHGGAGEDGHVQAVLEEMKLPYTGPGMQSCCVLMNKVISKQIFQAVGIPTPEYVVAHNADELTAAMTKLGLPLAIKPISGGSSIATGIVNSKAEALEAFVQAISFGPVLVERAIIGQEITVGMVDEEALPILSYGQPGSFYDFDAKYEAEFSWCEAKLADDVAQKAREYSVNALKAAGGGSISRADLIIDANDVPWLLEVNTVPGMTSHSLVPYAAAVAGIEFPTLVAGILSATIEANIYQTS